MLQKRGMPPRLWFRVVALTLITGTVIADVAALLLSFR